MVNISYITYKKLAGYLLFILLIAAGLAAEEISYNQEFRVDSGNNGYQLYPISCGISVLSDGRFVVCWTGRRESDREIGIFVQIFDPRANKIGGEKKVNTNPSFNSDANPSISALTSGGFVVCWLTLDPGGAGGGIRGQIFDQDGNKSGDEFLVRAINGGGCEFTVSEIPDGGFVVCSSNWDWDQDGSERGIYARIYNDNGQNTGEILPADTDTEYLIPYYHVTGLSKGGFIVCWQIPTDNNSSTTYGQKFDAYGNKNGNKFIVDHSPTENKYLISLDGLPNGEFVTCWMSFQESNYVFNHCAQRYDDQGNKINEEIQVYSASDISLSSLSALTSGGFVISWQILQIDEHGYITGPKIFAQMFDSASNKLGTYFLVSSVPSDISIPLITDLKNGGFVICWNILESWEDEAGIYGKYYIRPITHPLTPFSLLEPAFDVSLDTTTVTFRWSAASRLRINLPWEIEYTLYLDETEEFNHPRMITSIFDTTCTVDSLVPGRTYFWKVLASNISGDSLWSSETFGFFIRHVTSIDDRQAEPLSGFALFQNYPNPFNPETTIRYRLPDNQSQFHVVVEIYDVLGRLIITLKDEQQESGLYNLVWDGRDSVGMAVPSGIYFFRVSAGPYNDSQKMLLVR